MSEIRPDKIYQVPIEDGELYLSPQADHLHRWANLGFNILRYWNTDESTMHDVVMGDDSADNLERHAGIFSIPRTYFFTSEYEMYLDFKAEDLSDLDFDPEEDQG